MDRESIRTFCRSAKSVKELLCLIDMEELYEFFAALNIRDIRALVQANENDFQHWFQNPGSWRKFTEAVKILREEVCEVNAATDVGCVCKLNSLNGEDPGDEHKYAGGEQQNHDCPMISKDRFAAMSNFSGSANILSRDESLEDPHGVSGKTVNTSVVPKMEKLQIGEVASKGKNVEEKSVQCHNRDIQCDCRKVDGKKSCCGRENQIGYLAQINYGGIPRGMYDHFYDGIRMAGENSPHAVLSPQSITPFPSGQHAFQFFTSPLNSEIDNTPQFNVGSLMYYPPTLANLDVRYPGVNVVASNCQLAPQISTNAECNFVNPDNVYQPCSYFNNCNALSQQGLYCYSPLGNIDNGLTINNTKAAFTYTGAYGTPVCKPNSLYISTSRDGIHSNSSASSGLTNKPVKSKPQNFKAEHTGNQYFKAESGKLLPRRL
ncbi:unnamed protein product [Enterobius vermicularis]|uniref:F-box domain-containing protein n=1 Tax=Enterobius vermicularis TaxID=51028 RepID=A0A0N4VGY8_ENTVE|nr:unnamed protein product [Enterobius vermicularis]